ncbi:MAG: FKBP-type peptidyl-prolyl cis-trans isomerase [Rhodomicrobium sp.]
MRASPFPIAGAVFALAIGTALSGCSGGTSGVGATPVTTNAAGPTAGLQITDTKVGTGISPKPGQVCVVHYTGWLYENGAKGKKFDSSVDRKIPFSFVLGDHKVIEGWERGVSTMRVGGKRTLIIPPDLAYGTAGGGKAIPPNATLIFEVELLDVKAPS